MSPPLREELQVVVGLTDSERQQLLQIAEENQANVLQKALSLYRAKATTYLQTSRAAIRAYNAREESSLPEYWVYHYLYFRLLNYDVLHPLYFFINRIPDPLKIALGFGGLSSFFSKIPGPVGVSIAKDTESIQDTCFTTIIANYFLVRNMPDELLQATNQVFESKLDKRLIRCLMHYKEASQHFELSADSDLSQLHSLLQRPEFEEQFISVFIAIVKLMQKKLVTPLYQKVVTEYRLPLEYLAMLVISEGESHFHLFSQETRIERTRHYCTRIKECWSTASQQQFLEEQASLGYWVAKIPKELRDCLRESTKEQFRLLPRQQVLAEAKDWRAMQLGLLARRGEELTVWRQQQQDALDQGRRRIGADYGQMREGARVARQQLDQSYQQIIEQIDSAKDSTKVEGPLPRVGRF